MKIDPMKKVAGILFLLVTALITGGCSTVMTHPFPDPNTSLEIGVTDKHVSEEEWAPGAYHLGQTNVCFAKTQGEKDPDIAQALFGLLGRAIAVGDMAGEMKKMIKGEEDIYSLDLKSATQDALQKELKASNDDSRFSIGTDWKKSSLQITPYAVFSFIDDANARLWVVLRAEWFDLASRHKKWNCRYLVGLGDPRPLGGEKGWASDNGALLRSTVKNDLQLALRTLFEDLQGKLRTGKETQDGLYGNWVFYKNGYFANIQIIRSDKDWDIVVPLVEDEEYFAGVNILPKGFALPIPDEVHGVWGGMGH